ncbi:MAG: GcrA family cell cycle regulator [Bradyrhizobium sp.]|uniref:GcrA family cell cycle regulator n=1 Tax=Bradyrhizobium sp. TaxID=376 RepID=UPI002718DF14|nr:GcrA family cell cycle regulator [Bradyrhizobium sp.]MDO8399146.1 GcrA family cell cycle regulator [Bradyrhizobium sp.]
MQINWPPEHCDALREYLARGLSFAQAADAINARYGAAYSRNATIGRAKRMGLAVLDRSKRLSRVPKVSKPPRSNKNHERLVESKPEPPAVERPRRVELRCVQIMPRHLSVIDLETGDCRYPYGGDAEDEPITFCGHPQREGSSYCPGHFHLTRGPGTASERAAIPVALRLVAAA